MVQDFLFGLWSIKNNQKTKFSLIVYGYIHIIYIYIYIYIHLPSALPATVPYQDYLADLETAGCGMYSCIVCIYKFVLFLYC